MKQMKQSVGNRVVTSALAVLFFAAFANAGIVTRPFVSIDAKRRIWKNKCRIAILAIFVVTVLAFFIAPIDAAGAGNALEFDGSNDYVNVSANSSLNITGGITVEAWVKGQGAGFSNTTRTTSSFDKHGPQLQVVGSKVYYVWSEFDGSNHQIWTAEMNTDGTGWSATKRTSSSFDKDGPQLQVVGSKIYYVWYEYDGSYKQIWTAEMNTDGTGWSATKRTTGSYSKLAPQLQVVGSKIYYVWRESDGSNHQIWTAEINTDGTGWLATKKTTSSYSKYGPQLQVVGSKIYYVWYEYDGSEYQIWTAEINTDGTGWSATKRTTSSYSKHGPQLQVVGSKVYYVWSESDGSEYQIWTAEINTDGTGWSATKRTYSSYSKYGPQLQVVGSKIYYVWRESDGSGYQIWTAEMSIYGIGWSATKRTTSSYNKFNPQLQVVGSKIYYVWYEYDGSADQIWTAEMGSNIVNKGDFYGLGIMGNTVQGFIDAGVDGFKYKGDAISYTAGAVAEATIDTDWNHVAMTYDGFNVKLYVNGMLSDTEVFSESISTNPFDLMVGDDFNGTKDEVHIWNKRLSQDQIRDVMCRKLTETYVDGMTGIGWDENLTAYYRFDQSSGTSLPDVGPNSNNGTLKNMADDDWVTSTAAIGDKSHWGMGTSNLVENAEVPVDITWAGDDPGVNAIFNAMQNDAAPDVTTGLLTHYPSTYWELGIANNDSFNANATFHYDDIGGIGNETTLFLFTRSAAGESWSIVADVTRDDEGNNTDGVGSITANNLTGFSQFIITSADPANPVPEASTLIIDLLLIKGNPYAKAFNSIGQVY